MYIYGLLIPSVSSLLLEPASRECAAMAPGDGGYGDVQGRAAANGTPREWPPTAAPARISFNSRGHGHTAMAAAGGGLAPARIGFSSRGHGHTARAAAGGGTQDCGRGKVGPDEDQRRRHGCGGKAEVSCGDYAAAVATLRKPRAEAAVARRLGSRASCRWRAIRGGQQRSRNTESGSCRRAGPRARPAAVGEQGAPRLAVGNRQRTWGRKGKQRRLIWGTCPAAAGVNRPPCLKTSNSLRCREQTTAAHIYCWCTCRLPDGRSFFVLHMQLLLCTFVV